MHNDTRLLQTVATDQTAQVERLRADLARCHKELASLQRMVLSHESDLASAQLREQKAVRAKVLAERRLDDIKTSLSWRLTAPLRAIRQYLRPKPTAM